MNTRVFKKAILALDPFESELRLNVNAVKEIRHWIKDFKTSLEAVYVIRVNKSGINDDKNICAAEQALRNMVDSYGFGCPVRIKVLKEHKSSQRNTALTLAKYAKKEKVDVIALSSHGRQGLSRVVMGSFAENVIMEASVPVVVLGNKVSKLTGMDTIIFPTDFSKASHDAFYNLLNQLKMSPAKIILLNSTALEAYYYDYGLISFAGYLPDRYWKERSEAVKKTSERWIKDAQKNKLDVKLVVDLSSVDKQSAIESAVDEHHANYVALAGTHTRGLITVLIKKRKFHLWVFGPNVTKSKAVPAHKVLGKTKSNAQVSFSQLEN
jgi:hypothetical protein